MTSLVDLYHYIGGDLSVSSTGDLAGAADTMRGQQRVLRRLLTNSGDYIFHPDYGAGLPRWVGRTADYPRIRSLILGQMLLEDAVARKPAPIVNVGGIAGSDGGGFSVSIQYADAASGQPVTLSFNVDR